ncbi:MAG: pilin [Patescibacteria group bacterium]
MSKKFSKISTIIFLLLIVLQTGAFVFFILFYAPAKAQAIWTNPTDSFQVKIPGMDRLSEPKACPGEETKTCVPWIGEYIAGIYNYAIGIVGILAAMVLMFGGVIWLTAGGSSEKVKEAKAWIGASLTGLILALTSYMILYQINPDLVKFNPLQVNVITEMKKGIGCEWKLVSSVDKPTCDAGYIKAADSACSSSGEKPQVSATGAMGVSVSTYPICCCATAGGIGMCKPTAPYPDYCIECRDCENATIQCKETPCMVNKSLNAKLNTLYGKLASSGNMQINEPWPSTVKHSSSCHKDGTCVDVALKFTGTPEETCKHVDDIVNIAKGLGLKVLNEYTACEGKTYEHTTGNNIHIGL